MVLKYPFACKLTWKIDNRATLGWSQSALNVIHRLHCMAIMILISMSYKGEEYIAKKWSSQSYTSWCGLWPWYHVKWSTSYTWCLTLAYSAVIVFELYVLNTWHWKSLYFTFSSKIILDMYIAIPFYHRYMVAIYT